MAGALARLRFFTILWLLCQTFTLVTCLPFTPSPSNLPVQSFSELLPRRPTIINNNGNTTVIDSDTRQRIPQAPATDGGGIGFSTPALLWVAFSVVIGLPMCTAGIRGWRLTTGVAVGLGSTVCAWAAIINSVTEVGIPDIFLTLICFGIFLIGFTIGCFEFARIGSTVLLTLLGGFAFGIRVLLLKDDLLISTRNLFAVNWVIATGFGVVFCAVMVKSQRIAILLATSSVGTFLTFLGLDLVINKQAGLSRGLRFLFDRNSNHLVDILTTGYKQPLSTRIIVIASLVLIPAFAYGQHRFFKAPFNRNPQKDGVLNDDSMSEEGRVKSGHVTGLWDTAKLKSSRRFTLK